MRSTAGYATIGSAKAALGMRLVYVIFRSAQEVVLVPNHPVSVHVPLGTVVYPMNMCVQHATNSVTLAPLKQTLVISRAVLVVVALLIFTVLDQTRIESQVFQMGLLMVPRPL